MKLTIHVYQDPVISRMTHSILAKEKLHNNVLRLFTLSHIMTITDLNIHNNLKHLRKLKHFRILI